MRRILVKTMGNVDQGKHRGLTRAAIVKRALKIGENRGSRFGQPPPLGVGVRRDPDGALYCHVRDKQDLINAMAELAMEGFRPDGRASMS